MMSRSTVLLVGLLAFANAFGDDVAGAVSLDGWLEQQARVKSWSADVLQTRKIESLRQPLSSEGRVWFLQPNLFRWELGTPPRTIAVRSGDQLVVVYPRLKRVERYNYRDQEDPSLRQALALLEVGLPSDPKAFRARYELTATNRVADRVEFELRPADEAARRLIEAIQLEVGAMDGRLLATELIFPDGSRLRNEFRNYRLDPALDSELFSTESWADGP